MKYKCFKRRFADFANETSPNSGKIGNFRKAKAMVIIMKTTTWYYLDTNNGDKLFTVLSLPETIPCPTVIFRNPYVDDTETMTEDEAAEIAGIWSDDWTDRGYAVIWQHCRGRGKSTGEHIPFIYEREDGKALREWVRKQSFYNGEIFLCGGSYLSSVHFCSAPYEDDIKGAALEIMSTEVYELIYRNGFMKTGLWGGWYAGMYKNKQLKEKKTYHLRHL